MEQMENSPGLKRQADLLMSMIDYAVSHLGNLQELIPKLKDLGARHFVQYNTKPEHFEVTKKIRDTKTGGPSRAKGEGKG